MWMTGKLAMEFSYGHRVVAMRATLIRTSETALGLCIGLMVLHMKVNG